MNRHRLRNLILIVLIHFVSPTPMIEINPGELNLNLWIMTTNAVIPSI